MNGDQLLTGPLPTQENRDNTNAGTCKPGMGLGPMMPAEDISSLRPRGHRDRRVHTKVKLSP
jgi:hypothetical protein